MATRRIQPLALNEGEKEKLRSEKADFARQRVLHRANQRDGNPNCQAKATSMLDWIQEREVQIDAELSDE
jgi:hypothetical protein